jgi:hypothetical protein
MLLALLALVLTACGDDKSEPRAQPEPAPDHSAVKTGQVDPMVCLARGGVSNARKSGGDLWVGVRNEGGGGIRVQRFGSKPEAAQAVREARSIDAAAAGRYAVLGPLKGAGAADDVNAVAGCLKKG